MSSERDVYFGKEIVVDTENGEMRLAVGGEDIPVEPVVYETETESETYYRSPEAYEDYPSPMALGRAIAEIQRGRQLAAAGRDADGEQR